MKKNLFFLLFSFIMLGGSSAWALSKVDGVYQIGTADELIEFAGIVNDGELTAKAVLTADINMTGKSWTPIGGEGHVFNGEFDGQGHVIDYLDTSANYDVFDDQGIFGRVNGQNTKIRNLVAGPHNVIMGKARVGGIIGAVDGSGWLYLDNVGNEGYVKSSKENAGAIMGVVFNGGPATQITNCYNTGNVYGGWDSAIITGWFGGHGSVKVSNFWNTGVIENGGDGTNYLYRNSSGLNTWTGIYNSQNNYQNATLIAADALTSGAFAYQLNGNTDAGLWRQTLEGDNKDTHPTLIGTHGLVYANGEQNCDGSPKSGATVTYSNTEGANRDAHQYGEWGFCTVCDIIQTDFLTAVNGYYEIADEKQLNWFAEYVAQIDNTVNGKLTADVDFSTLYNNNEMIGPADGNPFKGIFDGQGHKVTVKYDANQKNSGLFRYIQNATIKNLIVDGTISNTQDCSGGIFAGSRGASVVENCVSYVTYNRSGAGDATFGGIGAYMHDNGIIRNCAFLGVINAPNAIGNGGILGYANGGANVKIQHCLLHATISVGNAGGDPFVRNTDPTDSYFVELGNLNSHPQGTQVTAAQVASGEVAYLLNSSVSGGTPWHQLIGTDADPLPIAKTGAVVYTQGSLYCDGAMKGDVTFVNTEAAPVQDAHHYTDGFCDNAHDGIVCNAYDPTYMTAVNGKYEVTTARQLRWTAAASQDNTAIEVKLMNDIDMSNETFGGFGSDADDKRFVGEIDGQFNVIKNLAFTADYANAGFVNAASVGAVIKNLTMDASCSFTGTGALGAFIGAVRGTSGNLYIENCGNEASVTTTGANGAGFIGCKYNDDVIPNLTNCYNVGVIRSGWDGGSFSGWMPKAKVVNCYSIVKYPTSEDTYGFQEGNQFSRGWSIDLTNCYDYGTGDWGTNNGTWGDAFSGNRKLNDEFIESGQLVVALNNLLWHQDLNSKHPVLHKNYTLDETFGHHQFYAHTDANISINRTLAANTWNTLILPFEMTAAEVTAFFGEGTQTATLKANGYDSATNNYAFEDGGNMISEGWPFLVKPTKAVTAPMTFTGKALTNDIFSTDTYFVGSYNPQSVAVGDKLVAAGNTLKTVTSTGQIKAFRAFFPAQAGGAAKDATFTIDGDPTGIIGINGDIIETANQKVYTINGQYLGTNVKTLRKGVYVIGGKKVVVK